jgi:hypothetical protein
MDGFLVKDFNLSPCGKGEIPQIQEKFGLLALTYLMLYSRMSKESSKD